MTSKTATPLPTGYLKDPVNLLAFGLGSGCAPVAPGTFGTLVAVPLYLLMALLVPIQYAVLTLILAVLGIGICQHASRRLGVHDHPGIVWDEVVGFLVTMFMVKPGLLAVLVGFGLFRLFDIWKPFPIRWLDRQVHGGMGIMLDDVVAGVYAAVLMQVLVWQGVI